MALQTRNVRWALFLFLLLFYGLWFSGQLYSKDEVLRGALTASLAERASLWFDHQVYGERFCRYQIGQSLAGIPFFFLDRLLFAIGVSDLTDITLLPLTNAVLSSLIGLFFLELALLLGVTLSSSLILTLAFSFCGLLLPYSRTFLSEPLITLSLLASFYFLVLAGDKGKSKYFLLSGLFFGLGLVTKLTVVLFLPLYASFLLIRLRQGNKKLFLPGQAARPNWSYWLIFLIPVAIALTIDGWVNYKLWGSPFQTGYEKEGFTTGFFTGAYGLLLSVGRGLFLHCPWVLASFLCLPYFYKRHRDVALFCLAIFFLHLILYSRFWTWHGGWTPGTRFLIPTLPFLFLPLLSLTEEQSSRLNVIRPLAVMLLVASFIIQIMMTLVNPLDYNNDLFGLLGQRENEFLFIPQVSSLWGLWQLILDGRFDPYIFKLFSASKWPGLIIYWLVVCGLVYSGLCLWRKLVPEFSPRRLWKNMRTAITRYQITILGIVFLIFLLAISGALMGPRGLLLSFTAGGEFISQLDKRTRLLVQPRQDSAKYSWRGLVETPVSGHYWLYLKVKGRYRLAIDNEVVFFNDQEIPQHLPQKKIYWEKGFHSLAIDYSPYPGTDGIFFLYWTVPGEGSYIQPIASVYLYPGLPGNTARFFTAMYRQVWWFGLFLLVPLFLLESLLRPQKTKPT